MWDRHRLRGALKSGVFTPKAYIPKSSSGPVPPNSVVVGVLFITTIYASHKVNHIHGLGQLTTHYAFSWPMDTSTPTTSVVGRCKVRNLRLGLHQSLNLLGQCLNMLSKGKSSCFSFHLVDRPLHDSPIPIIVVGIGAHVPYHLDGISLHYREAPLKRGAGTLGPISDGVLWKYINAFVLQTTKRIVPFQFVRGDRVILVSPPLRIA
ncbi:hypothetical protein D0Y65_053373 [Glycine soja]|uniref:Uncharacterized protein n=1 Tax=Glycine soja TaxID=3848 RepID=A0A445F1Z0_GLYSO|nr:hypothetical protein D0Y65_053373 [Glycine soja]